MIDLGRVLSLDQLQNALQGHQYSSSVLNTWHMGVFYVDYDDPIFYFTKNGPQSVAALKPLWKSTIYVIVSSLSLHARNKKIAHSHMHLNRPPYFSDMKKLMCCCPERQHSAESSDERDYEPQGAFGLAILRRGLPN